MKNFNQEIQVTVAVDTIAEMLLNSFAPDAKHREIIAEAIVGRMLSSDKAGLGFLYNSLNGYPCTVNFKVGDEVMLKDHRAYAYWTPKSIEEKSSVYGDVVSATVVAIDEYSDKKLKVEYAVPGRDGLPKIESEWLNHTKCSRIPVGPVSELAL